MFFRESASHSRNTILLDANPFHSRRHALRMSTRLLALETDSFASDRLSSRSFRHFVRLADRGAPGDSRGRRDLRLLPAPVSGAKRGCAALLDRASMAGTVAGDSPRPSLPTPNARRGAQGRARLEPRGPRGQRRRDPALRARAATPSRDATPTTTPTAPVRAATRSASTGPPGADRAQADD